MNSECFFTKSFRRRSSRYSNWSSCSRVKGLAYVADLGHKAVMPAGQRQLLLPYGRQFAGPPAGSRVRKRVPCFMCAGGLREDGQIASIRAGSAEGLCLETS